MGDGKKKNKKKNSKDTFSLDDDWKTGYTILPLGEAKYRVESLGEANP